MSEPVITIGLPVHNAAGTIVDTIKSVFTQSFTNWKLLIVDDASTDGTLDIIQGIRHERVTVVHHYENAGLAQRLNEIAQLTASPFLARLDADDLMSPDRLETQVRYLEAHPTIDMVATDAITIDECSRPYGYLRSNPDPSRFHYFKGGPYIHPTITGRSDWFRANPYDANLRRAEDQELWIRTLRARQTAVIPLPFMYYREGNTVTPEKYRRSIDATKTVIHMHKREFLTRPESVTALASSELKARMYSVLDRLGHSNLMIARRSIKLTASEVEHHRDVISRITATDLPRQ